MSCFWILEEVVLAAVAAWVTVSLHKFVLKRCCWCLFCLSIVRDSKHPNARNRPPKQTLSNTWVIYLRLCKDNRFTLQTKLLSHCHISRPLPTLNKLMRVDFERQMGFLIVTRCPSTSARLFQIVPVLIDLRRARQLVVRAALITPGCGKNNQPFNGSSYTGVTDIHPTVHTPLMEML